MSNRAARLRAIFKDQDHQALLEEFFKLYSRGFIFTEQQKSIAPETSDPEDEYDTVIILIGLPWSVTPWSADEDTITLTYEHDSNYQPTRITWRYEDFLDEDGFTLTQFRGDLSPSSPLTKWVVTNIVSDEYQRQMQEIIVDRNPYFEDPQRRYAYLMNKALVRGMDWGKGRQPLYELEDESLQFGNPVVTTDSE